MITQKGRDEVEEAWPEPNPHYEADWNEIPIPGLPHDFTEWEVIVVILALIGLTGLILFAVAELHRDARASGSQSNTVRAEARPQLAQDAHTAELVRQHRHAVMDGLDLLR